MSGDKITGLVETVKHNARQRAINDALEVLDAFSEPFGSLEPPAGATLTPQQESALHLASQITVEALNGAKMAVRTLLLDETRS